MISFFLISVPGFDISASLSNCDCQHYNREKNRLLERIPRWVSIKFHKNQIITCLSFSITCIAYSKESNVMVVESVIIL